MRNLKPLPHEKACAEWESRTPTSMSTKNTKYITSIKYEGLCIVGVLDSHFLALGNAKKKVKMDPR
jgi:hypothetical protein